ncbi:cytochrome P450 [Mycobacterium sp. BMJ-28]
MTATAQSQAWIPEPPALPFVGHALSIPGGADTLVYVMSLAEELGPIFRLRVFAQELVFVAGADLVAELSDPARFRKSVHHDLVRLRDIGGDGLFTAFNDEPNWRKAHDILLPAFSLEAMRDYHATMVGVARALVSRWDDHARNGDAVEIAADMTRLTFDTIGLCGFGFDLQSFERDQPHPFIVAMTRALLHAQSIGETPPVLRGLKVVANCRYQQDIALMRDVVDKVIRARRDAGSADTTDLLGRMLNTPDKRTGSPLDVENIRNQVITFLIAGHETTSGAMSFAIHYLAKHPAVLLRAQSEVDALWGIDDDIDPSHADVGRLTYMQQVLNEALRLWPTAPGYAVEPTEDTVIGGRYDIPRGASLQILIPQLHRDRQWGDSVESFDPERFSLERSQQRPVHLFKPFGNGERACIGRQFALHEATLVLAMLVHRYRFDDHTNYQLRIAQTLTIKPDGLTLRLIRRTAADRRRALPGAAPQPSAASAPARLKSAGGAKLLVLHGSNLGTSAGIGRDLAAQGTELGFNADVKSIDKAVGQLADGTLAVIVASSYNGLPTDDAAQFVDWLQKLPAESLRGVRYAVLGVGDRNWAATYQYIPTLLDQRLAAAGATRVLERGVVDVAGDFAGMVDGWTAALWATLLQAAEDAAPPIERTPAESVYIVEPAPESLDTALKLAHGLQELIVLQSHELVDTSSPIGRSKRFLRLSLPADAGYRTGDHLAVLPRNCPELVERVAARFDLNLDSSVIIRRSGRSRVAMPTDSPVTLRAVLSDYVELQQPATQEQLSVLAQQCACPPERTPLEELANDAAVFAERVTATGISILDVLERYRSVELGFDAFLDMLPGLRPRRYSISSSPLAQPHAVDLMVALLEVPHRDGAGTYRGTGSYFVSRLQPGDVVLGRVLACNEAFRVSPGQPLIAIAAGTGLAPFRGMIHDRLHTSDRGALTCYFGCDDPDVDYLHRAELEQSQADGAVDMRPTFALAPENGHTFVQHRIIDEHERVWSQLEGGAAVRVCGDANRLVPGVEAALREVYLRHGGGHAEAGAWLDELRNTGRYVVDAWSN